MAEAAPARVAELRGVSAGYAVAGGSRSVLDRLDLSLHARELVALLGPNGSGKTTLLRVLAGTLAPSSGTVRLFGRSIVEWRRDELARRVAILPQLSQLPDGFRVGEIVAMGRIPHADSWFGATAADRDAVDAALRDTDLPDLGSRPVSALSGGERQRVLVALALAQEPTLLLLDEPTLHLDLAHQRSLIRLLRRLRTSRGLTVLAVLHDLNLAASFADRAVLLHEGRAVDAGSRRMVIDPAHARRVFGVPVEEAVTAAGRRVLAPSTGED
jgi:iron complex transport system ATP-binding protein